MKWPLIFLLFSLFYGCGSTSITTDADLEDDFDSISNEDFKVVGEMPYSDYEDIYDGDFTNNDSLATESIARLPEAKLESVTNKVANPISKGISLCYRRKFNEAFAIFDKTYFKYKSHPSYWNQIGTCYFLRGESKKAFLYYNKARDINPNYVPAINNHGVLYQKDGNMQKALSAYKKASRLNSFFMTPIFNIGQLYLKFGLIDKAKEIFKTLVNKNPNDADAINGLATSYFFAGNTSSAIAYWKKLDSDTLEKPYVGINYAMALFISGKSGEAESVIDDVNTKNLGALAYYYKKAKLYIGAGG